MNFALIDGPGQPTFPQIGCGGLQTCVENLAFGLTSQGHKAVVFSPAKVPEQEDVNYPFEIIRTNCLPKSHGPTTAEEYYEQIRPLVKERNDIDCVLANGDPDNVKFWPNMHRPVILTCHSGIQKKHAFGKKDGFAYRFLSKDHYDLWCHTEDEIKYSFWQYSGMSNKNYKKPEKLHGNYLLAVSSLSWGFKPKGIDKFIAMSIDNPSWDFVFYGVGNPQLEDYLKQLDKKLNNFFYGGLLRRGKKHDQVFSEAAAFCQFTQLREACCRTTMEAMCKGTPILSLSPFGSTAEILDGTSLDLDKEPSESEVLQYVNSEKVKRSIYSSSFKFHVNQEINAILKYVS